MIRPWRTAQAVRAATTVIGPLVAASRARVGPVPESAWLQPYMLGFMAMLIALVAAHRTQGRIDSDQLGLAQIRAFARITGVMDDSVGEQLCLLSAAGDESFLSGCRNALNFLKAYNGEHDPDDPDIEDVWEELSAAEGHTAWLGLVEPAVFGKGGLVAASLWQRYFDDHLFIEGVVL